jgi:hypothetical protein
MIESFSDELHTRLDAIRGLRKKSSHDPTRFRDYAYLGAVFNLYVFVRSNKCKKVAMSIMADDLELTITPDTHLIRALIDATCKVDPKTRSRWTRALRYAWKQRRHWDRLPRFLRRNGGIAGCADWFTETQRRRSRRASSRARLPSDGQLRFMKESTERSRARLMALTKSRPAPVQTFVDRRLTVGERDKLAMQKQSSNR